MKDHLKRKSQNRLYKKKDYELLDSKQLKPIDEGQINRTFYNNRNKNSAFIFAENKARSLIVKSSSQNALINRKNDSEEQIDDFQHES